MAGIMGRLSGVEKVLGFITAVLTLIAAILSFRVAQVGDQNAGLQGTVDSLTRRTSNLAQENETLSAEVKELTRDRDDWKRRAEQGGTSPSTPTPTPSPGPTDGGYEFEFADRSYFDFDARKADLKGGADYEVKLSFGRFFHGSVNGAWDGTEIKYIKSEGASLEGCERGTDIQSGKVAFLRDVEQDESICIRTSGGKWAILKIVASEPSSSGLGTGNVTFNVRLVG